MQLILLIIALIVYLFILFNRKIPLTSFYFLFGLEWLYYWIFPYLVTTNAPDISLFKSIPLLFNGTCTFYFFVFNALSLLIFCLVYLLFYKNKHRVDPDMGFRNNYHRFLFPAIIILSVIIIILAIIFPYSKGLSFIYDVISNIRIFFFAMFILFMICEPDKRKVVFVFLVYCAATFIYGSRIHMVMVAISLFFYLLGNKYINKKTAIVLVMLVILLISATAVRRMGTNYNYSPVSLLWSLSTESINSSYPLLQVINLWQNNEIKYYTIFSNYIVDPIISFVPQPVFMLTGEGKYTYNTLGAWREAHGGGIAPWGAFYYLAEAFISLSYYGIIIVSIMLGLLGSYMDSISRKGNLMRQFMCYNFIGVFGSFFIKTEFFLVGKIFILSTIFAIVILLAINGLSIIGKRQLR